MADASLWPILHRALQRWFRTACADQEMTPVTLAGVLRHIDPYRIAALVYPDLEGLSAAELAIALALVGLGPQDAGAPPTTLAHDLFQIACEELPELEPERCVELVIAWGCGWRRAPRGSTATWDGRWEPAVLGLWGMVFASIRETLRILRRMPLRSTLREAIVQLSSIARACGEPDGLYEVSPLRSAGDLGLFANHITLKLIDGSAANLPRHQLHSWRPQQQMLRSFVATAVRGLASPSMKGGAFAHSMLYPLLNEQIGLHIGQVRFTVCHAESCNGMLIRRAIQHGTPLRSVDLTRGVYEGAMCPDCHTPGDARRSYYLPRRHRLLMPHTYGGSYELRETWRCTHCGTLYPCSASYLAIHAQINTLRRQISAYQQARINPDPTQSHHNQSAVRTARTALFQQTLRALRILRQTEEGYRSAMICPLCGNTKLPQRLTSIWVYTPLRHVFL